MTVRRDVTAVLLNRWDLTPTAFGVRFRLAGGIPRPVPGQFVMIRPAGTDNPFWRRAFSVAGFAAGGAGETLDLMVKAVGPGTRLWKKLPERAPVEILGPLGTGYPLESVTGPLALVAGGIGLPPLFYAIPELVARGVRCDLYLGAATERELIDPVGCARLLEPAGGRLFPTTEDGSAGEAGLVTEVLERHLAGGAGYAAVWSCGPMPMLRAVAAVAARRGVPAWLALEERMACGVGVCLGCVVPGADGGHLRVCREGPVVRADEIDWGRL